MTILHQIGSALREILGQVPLLGVRLLFVAVLALVLLWVLTLPRSETVPPGAPASLGNNLKFWAALALLAQIAIYCLV